MYFMLCTLCCNGYSKKLNVNPMQTIMGAVWMMGLFEGIKGVNKKVLVKVNMACWNVSFFTNSMHARVGACFHP